MLKFCLNYPIGQLIVDNHYRFNCSIELILCIVTGDDDVNADFSRWTFCTGRARHWFCALGSGVVNRKLRLPRFPLWWRQHSGGVPASGCSDLSPHWTASSPLTTMEICLQIINFHRLWRHLKITPGSLSNAQKYRFILCKIKCNT